MTSKTAFKDVAVDGKKCTHHKEVGEVAVAGAGSD
jgi:hypothetical protein